MNFRRRLFYRYVENLSLAVFNCHMRENKKTLYRLWNLNDLPDPYVIRFTIFKQAQECKYILMQQS